MEKSSRILYLCTRFPKEMLLGRISEKVLKIYLKKLSEKFCVYQKTIYLCTRFPKEMLLERVSEKGSENFSKKNFLKVLVV